MRCSVSGYCGEASLQSAALYYGNYISQERARLAGGAADTQLLIGVNFETAQVFGLNIATWDYNAAATPQSAAFLNWTRTQIAASRPVLIGVYLSETGGDPDYDHIVPVTGIDGTTLQFNDLFSPSARSLSLSTGVTTRSQCVTAAPTQPYGYCVPKGVDYGVAVVGNRDAAGETFPTSLSVGRCVSRGVFLS